MALCNTTHTNSPIPSSSGGPYSSSSKTINYNPTFSPVLLDKVDLRDSYIHACIRSKYIPLLDFIIPSHTSNPEPFNGILIFLLVV